LKDANVWGPRQSLIKRALQRIDANRANAALAHAAQIDRIIKGLGTGDVWNEFLRLGLRIAAT
jgi:DNA polymerase-3 subunit delta